MKQELDLLRRRFGTHQPGLMGATKEYAVLCPFAEKEDGLHLLLEVRSDQVSQAGEVCFPGGRMEPGETPEAAALRETKEELGIPADAITLIGQADFMVGRRSALLRPVLGLVSPAGMEAIKPSSAEVAQVFTVPLSFFQTVPPTVYTYNLLPQIPEDFPYEAVGISRDYPWRTDRQEVPLWFYEGHPIWGMTARIIRHLISQL